VPQDYIIENFEKFLDFAMNWRESHLWGGILVSPLCSSAGEATVFRPCLVFKKNLQFLVTSNIVLHPWSIKYR
jgi:hypothetical protein